MSEPRRIGCAPALVATLLAVLAVAAPAGAACRADAGGIGGTGHAPAGKASGPRGPEDRGGIGGTGRRDEGGVGGTGRHAEGGVGGTGIVGVITAFGSVCVNGLEVVYDASTPVDADGTESAPHSLALGQLVVIDAADRGGMLHAERIGVRNAVVGPVTRVDAAHGALDVLGQHVLLDRATQLAGAGGKPFAPVDLAAGDFVAVSGLRGADGSVVATRVEAVAPRELVSVTGPLTVGGRSRASVGALAIEAPASSALRDLGSRVALVIGRLDAASGALRAERITPALSFANAPARLSLEGLVQARTARGFRTGLADVDTSDLGAGAATAAIGARVVVTGSLDESGQLRAERVEVLAPDRSAIGDPIGILHDGRGSQHEADEQRAGEIEDDEHVGHSSHPEAPEVEHEGPERPEKIEKPDHPETPEHVERPETPEIPEIEKPETPEVPDVARPETPEVPEVERPVIPEVPQVERPAIPDVPEVERPEAPEVHRPETPEIERPEAPERPAHDD